MENIPSDVPGGGRAEEEESAVTAASETETSDVKEKNLDKKEGGEIDLCVPEEDLLGVLEDLELTLKMTSVMEQEKIGNLNQPVETESACSTVRRRNKRRRAKKDLH